MHHSFRMLRSYARRLETDEIMGNAYTSELYCDLCNVYTIL